LADRIAVNGLGGDFVADLASFSGGFTKQEFTTAPRDYPMQAAKAVHRIL
jgi:hypothetical protein